MAAFLLPGGLLAAAAVISKLAHGSAASASAGAVTPQAELMSKVSPEPSGPSPELTPISSYVPAAQHVVVMNQTQPGLMNAFRRLGMSIHYALPSKPHVIVGRIPSASVFHAVKKFPGVSQVHAVLPVSPEARAFAGGRLPNPVSVRVPTRAIEASLSKRMML